MVLDQCPLVTELPFQVTSKNPYRFEILGKVERPFFASNYERQKR